MKCKVCNEKISFGRWANYFRMCGACSDAEDLVLEQERKKRGRKHAKKYKAYLRKERAKKK